MGSVGDCVGGGQLCGGWVVKLVVVLMVGAGLGGVLVGGGVGGVESDCG